MTAASLTVLVVAVEKQSALSYLHHLFDLYEGDVAVLPVDSLDAPLPAGLEAVSRIPCDRDSGWFTRPAAPRHSDAIAQISLTSGTTGASKAMAISHRAFADVTERLIAVQGLDSEIREYVGVPVTYSFGLGRIRAVAAVGGASFLPARGFRVDEFAAMLERGEVNALSAVPTLLRLVLASRARFEGVGASLRWLEIGSQAMSAAEKEGLKVIFPNARIVQHYGLTEASRTSFLTVSEESGEALQSVGRAIGDVELRITGEGLIAIRGPHVASGMVTAEGLTPLTDAEGWLVTRDLGRLSDGLLFFEGRADDLVNVGGVKVPAEQFEERLLAVVGADAPIACGGASDALLGQILIVAHDAAMPPERVERVRAAAADIARQMNIGESFALLPVAEIPRTQTGKVRRKELDALYAAHLAAAPKAGGAASSALLSDPDEGVRQAFRAVFGTRAEDGSQSLLTLNGDSLQYVNILLALEPYVPRMPEEWDTLSIDSLAALALDQASAGLQREAGRRTIPDNLNAVRGLACAMIVALHVVGVGADEGLKLPLESLWHSVMNLFTPVRLPLFTAMSGFLYAAMPATRDGFVHFVRRKLDQLLLPLLFATFIFWSLRKLAFGRNDSLVMAYVEGYQHLWFIDALLLIFIAAAAIDTAIRSRRAIWWGILLVVPFLYPFVPVIPVLHIKNALFLFPFFGFGILLYREPRLLGSTPLALGSLLLLVPLLGSQFIGEGAHNLFESNPVVRWVAPIAAILACLRYFPRIRLLEMLAIYSFTVYLWHPAANGLVRTVALKLGIANIPLLFVIGMAAGLLGPIILHRIVERFPKVSHLFIGR